MFHPIVVQHRLVACNLQFSSQLKRKEAVRFGRGVG